jgi:soluble lytic murein transglycosylase-like protein
MLLILFAGPAAAAVHGDRPVQAVLAGSDAEEQMLWGGRYEHGEGVSRDFDAALRLYCHAARSGNADAHYRLGWMYANGRGVARNEAQAAAWFRLAAAQGDTHAERMLARLGEPAPRPRCLRPDGSEYEEPLRSVAAPERALIVTWVRRLAPQFGLDPDLVLAVVRAESNFNPRARSSKDARGLMQLIPATAKRFGVDDIWDPLQNLKGGMAYLRWLLDHFDGDEALALAGYNAGEGAVRRYRGIPPYAETRDYVKKIARWRLRPAGAGPV